MRDQPLALPFDPAGIVLDRRRGLSLQLYQALRARVLDGRLSSGTRLPASRDLAKVLALSRNSVVRAYDQLYAEGYIESRVGDGTYVSRLPKLSTELSTGLYPRLSTGLSTFVDKSTEDLSSNASSSVWLDRLKNHHLPAPRSGPPRAFRVGVPAFDLFPFDVWAKLHAGFWRNPDPARLGYGDPAGEPQLRELIAAYLRQSRGISCTAGQIVITSGAQQAITLCAQLLVQPGQA
ncbi:MAG: PLP-dependent aminotransferase family protein, partial [Pseudomonas sp.]